MVEPIGQDGWESPFPSAVTVLSVGLAVSAHMRPAVCPCLSWHMDDGRWTMADGRWQLVEGVWPARRRARPHQTHLCRTRGASPHATHSLSWFVLADGRWRIDEGVWPAICPAHPHQPRLLEPARPTRAPGSVCECPSFHPLLDFGLFSRATNGGKTTWLNQSARMGGSLLSLRR
jgi:hypothetical protein